MSAKYSPQFGQSGNTKYGKNVIISIISLAAQEIAGVVSLHSKGVKIEFDEANITVDVFLKILYGHSAADVAFRVQENIKRNVESMSGYKVRKINVNILEVAFQEPAQLPNL